MDEAQFKPFRETYKKITFALCVGMIYPNPKTDRWRLAYIPFLLLTITPLALMVFSDVYVSWRQKDIVNIIRHSTVIGPFLGGYFKLILMYHKREQAKQILDEIDRDHESFNHMPDEYKQFTAKAIRHSQVYCERVWVIIVMTCVLTFPAMAVVQNLYEFVFKLDSEKYLVHDVNRPFAAPEARFESPFFELLFAYELYYCMLYVINFIGYDGFFGLSINHACLKIQLCGKGLEDALRSAPEEIHEKIVGVILEQKRMFEFVSWIQDTFNIWLGLIFIATMIQICTCLYHITEGYGFDLRYMIFVTGAIIHIFLPCRYAAKLKALSAETGTRVYCSGWENIPSQSVRKTILFMIARGQAPIEITAFNMLAFDMELFLSIMQTSYSMFTLLRS